MRVLWNDNVCMYSRTNLLVSTKQNKPIFRHSDTIVFISAWPCHKNICHQLRHVWHWTESALAIFCTRNCQSETSLFFCFFLWVTCTTAKEIQGNNGWTLLSFVMTNNLLSAKSQVMACQTSNVWYPCRTCFLVNWPYLDENDGCGKWYGEKSSNTHKQLWKGESTSPLFFNFFSLWDTSHRVPVMGWHKTRY